jgi:hypothetical protein
MINIAAKEWIFRKPEMEKCKNKGICLLLLGQKEALGT